MANENIIVKFQVEGADKFNKDIEKSADVILDVAKAQNIVNQSTGNLTKKQLELKEQISSTGGILQKLNETGKTSGTLYTDLQSKLKKLVAEYQNENKELEKKSVELKKVTLDSNNYAKVLEQVAKGEISAREAMMLLKNEMINVKLAGKENTVQFQQLRNTAGELKDVISDTSQEMSNAGSDTRGLDKAIRVTNTVVAGFSLAQGAAGLFGGENENLQKTLLKVNSAMLVLNGLQQIQEEITKKDSLFTTAATKAKELYTAAMYGASRATQILYGVMTGGLLIALGLALTYWKEIAEAIGINIDNSEKLAEVQERLKKIEEDRKALNDAELRYLKAKGESQAVILKKELVLAEQEHKKLLQEIEFAKAITKLGLNKNDPAYFYKAKKAKEKEIEIEKQYQAQLLNSKSKILEIKKALDDFNTKRGGGSKVVLNELEKLKAELQKKQKEIEAEISRAVVKEGKSETKLSVKLRAEIEGIEQQIKIIENLLEKKPLKAFVELQIQNGQDFEASLKREIEDAHTKFKDLFNLILQSDGDIKNNSALQEQANQVKELQERLNSLMNVYNSYFEKANEDSGIQLPDMFADFNPEGFINSITETKDVGKDKYKEMYDYINDLREQGILDEERANEAHEALQNARLNSIVENAEKAKIVYDMLYNTMSQGADLARQVISNNSERELQVLEEKKNRGLISEKQYQKEQAKIKNDAARKEHAANTAMAFAQIPMAILSAFVGTPGGIIIKSIAAGVAGAFALATAIMVASAPIPKYRHGGQVFKGNGFVKGRSHSDGGVNAELEGNEFVMKREAVAMYGVNNFNKLNNGLLRPDIFSPNVSNYTNQLERIDYTKEFKKMNEILEFIYQSTEDGNNIAMQVGKKIIAKENRDARRYN